MWSVNQTLIIWWLKVAYHLKVGNRMGRAFGSFSTNKLDEIIASMRVDADRIDKLVPIVQGRLDKREQEEQAEERRLAGLARDEQKAFFEEHIEELRLRNLDRRSEEPSPVGSRVIADKL